MINHKDGQGFISPLPEEHIMKKGNSFSLNNNNPLYSRNEEKKMDEGIVALIYPLSTINGYGALWSLGRVGIPVIGLSSINTVHSESRFLKEFHMTPDDCREPESFVDSLLALGKRMNSKMVLFTMTDTSAFVASAYRNQLDKYYLYPYLTWDQLCITLDRRAMFDAAITAGLQVPRTWFPEDRSWTNLNPKELSYPVIIKPLVSRFQFEDKKIKQAWTFTNKYGKAIEVHSAEALADILPRLIDEGLQICVQERIKCEIDDLWSHHFYCIDGEILASFTGRKLHQEPPDFGTGIICKAEANSHIVKESENFLRQTKYNGIGNIEYIETLEGYKFVEINPRAYFWSSLGTACGVNLFKIMYDHMCGNQINRADYFQNNRHLIWYDIGSLPKFFRYKQKRISVMKLLLASKMEAVANISDIRGSVFRIYDCLRQIYKFIRIRFLNKTKLKTIISNFRFHQGN